MRRVHLNQKRAYDTGRRSVSYEANDLVLIYKPTRILGRSEKLLHRWQGPYIVVRRTSSVNYEVRLFGSKSSKTDIVHVVSLKPYYAPIPMVDVAPSIRDAATASGATAYPLRVPKQEKMPLGRRFGAQKEQKEPVE